MTPEKQRIAIAEACPSLFRIAKESGDIIWMRDGFEQDCDPLNDLNAMHEAEEMLTGHPMDENSQKSAYSEQLVLACNGEGDVDIWFWHQIHATAAQRAEAFLKTLGIWVDE